MTDADACSLVGLPEDVERRLLASLTAYDCVALRASSKSVGCQLVSEVNLTHRLDAAIREKGLSGVLTYQKRCETVLQILLQWMAAIFSAVSTLVQVAVGFRVFIFIYMSIHSWAVVLTPFLVQQLAVFPWIQWPIQWLLYLLAWVVPFLVIDVAIRWLGEASFVVRAFRQFWVAYGDACDLLRSGGVICFDCALALLFISEICISWIWPPSDESSVQPVIVAMRWHLGMLSPVCLGIMCRLIWYDLVDVLRLVDTREGYLLRVLYVIEEGGCWDRCVSLIYYLKNSRRLPSLPITITAHDLQRAGSRAVFDTRPPAVRQYSLFSHRVRQCVDLSRVNGQDYLGWPDRSTDTGALTYVSIDLTESDPPTKRDEYVYSSFTDIIVRLIDRDFVDGNDFRLRPHFTLPDDLIIPPPKQYQLTRDVMRQPRGQWKGCRKADEWSVDGASMQLDGTILILCGDKAADDFLVRVDSRLTICTTEPPVAWKRRPDERYPQTAALVRQKVAA
ncbi:unnamed protein product [Vitrella brassicaformis CCMP3155]|uniref:F-box domain-containing protein n=1 Tax=Vitrella brassicaformis (strain CCMP3155) TaxID=1169540 RepID=A0A0G4EEW5_VITBC|nr:unnamed protein product [Vitrella brassicaformis CCMP3155]|eukprot:CEL93950.1 unnamed protein product [Vitrella brassicaformis CCMP3155]